MLFRGATLPRCDPLPELRTSGRNGADMDKIAAWNRAVGRTRSRERKEKRKNKFEEFCASQGIPDEFRDQQRQNRVARRRMVTAQLETRKEALLQESMHDARVRRRRGLPGFGAAVAAAMPLPVTPVNGAAAPALGHTSPRHTTAAAAPPMLASRTRITFSSGAPEHAYPPANSFLERLQFGNLSMVRVALRSASTENSITYYIVEVTCHGGAQWLIRRTYDQFSALRDELMAEFRQLEHVPFPGRYSYGELWDSVVQERVEGLGNFLRQTLALPLTPMLDEFLVFSPHMLDILCDMVNEIAARARNNTSHVHGTTTHPHVTTSTAVDTDTGMTHAPMRHTAVPPIAEESPRLDATMPSGRVLPLNPAPALDAETLRSRVEAAQEELSARMQEVMERLKRDLVGGDTNRSGGGNGVS